ncbi:MAG: Phosphoribosyltransferase [Candidatus Woesebacteria bacterium GW2011_GWC1_30_29]|nr:MAG: Phosphoribosyltransferase [Candidatus Woesebacteria bacterium GW2011_GWC1_30_29]
MDLINFLFPKECLECKDTGRYICSNCVQKVRVGGLVEIGNLKVYSVWKYEGVIRKAIISLKYKFATEIAEELTVNISNYLPLKSKSYILAPIPMHWHKKNIRGFNQTEIIGEKLAKSEVRRENLSGVFEINSEIKISKTSKILLFDDVLTTGSTIVEATKVLKSSGFNNIIGLTIAR